MAGHVALRLRVDPGAQVGVDLRRVQGMLLLVPDGSVDQACCGAMPPVCLVIMVSLVLGATPRPIAVCMAGWPSRLCRSTWPLRCPSWLNFLSQILQVNALTPVCTVWCVRTWDFWENPLPQVAHLNGRFRECTTRCRLRLPLWLKTLPQMSH